MKVSHFKGFNFGVTAILDLKMAEIDCDATDMRDPVACVRDRDTTCVTNFF